MTYNTVFDVAAMEERYACSSSTVFVIRHSTLNLAEKQIVGVWQICYSD